MSAIVYVNFNATSLSDFDDELLIVAEESSFKVRDFSLNQKNDDNTKKREQPIFYPK